MSYGGKEKLGPYEPRPLKCSGNEKLKLNTKASTIPSPPQGRNHQLHTGTSRLSKHRRFFCAKGNGLVRRVGEQRATSHRVIKHVFTPHLTPTLISIANNGQGMMDIANNAAVGLTLQKTAWLHPKERGQEERRKDDHRIRERKEKRKNRRERGERKENTKKKDIKWFLPHCYFSFLPKELGRF